MIQFLWVRGELSKLERLCLKSFVYYNHKTILYSYDNIDVPEGVILKDARDILPESEIFVAEGSLGAFSDYFRFKMLLDNGGYWADTDMLCVKKFDFEEPYLFATELVLKNKGQTITSGLIKCPPNSEIMKSCYDFVSTITKKTNIKWGDIGPSLLGNKVAEFGLEKYITSYQTFCPIHFSNYRHFVDPRHDFVCGEETYCVHLWNEMWRRNSQDKNATYHIDCFYERMKEKYDE